MRLTQRTDLALRGLMHLTVCYPEHASANDMAGALAVSVHHLTKSLQALRKAGFIVSLRGHAGGHRLAQPPGAISVGAVVRALEEPALVECFRPGGACVLKPRCGLADAFQRALEAFYESLDAVTLADLATPGLERLIATRLITLPAST